MQTQAGQALTDVLAMPDEGRGIEGDGHAVWGTELTFEGTFQWHELQTQKFIQSDACWPECPSVVVVRFVGLPCRLRVASKTTTRGSGGALGMSPPPSLPSLSIHM